MNVESRLLATAKRSPGTRGLAGVLVTLGLAASLAWPAAPIVAATPGDSGIVCTDGSLVGNERTFELFTNTGYVGIPDGNTIFMWSYALGGGQESFQLPGPTLCANEDEHVVVMLTNSGLTEASSILFPGLSGALAGGVPVQPQFDGGALVSFVQSAAPGATVTYEFDATDPGTYLYESGTDPGKQVPMGMYGALVIRPAGHADWAYNDDATQFNAAAEYVMLLSEVDPELHMAVERGKPYIPARPHPRYWMINGRSFPDTIAPNGAAWLPAQPYGALVHIQPKTDSNPYPALVRYLNAGALNHPFHPHGNHGRVIGRDARLLKAPSGGDTSYEKFLVMVGAGQTWDVTYEWTDVEMWNPVDNQIPVTIPQLQNLTFKDGATWYSGSPYLGYEDELPTGTTSFNECGEYYHVWHSHALNEAANYDAGFGGMLTLQRIDPPGGCPDVP